MLIARKPLVGAGFLRVVLVQVIDSLFEALFLDWGELADFVVERDVLLGLAQLHCSLVIELLVFRKTLEEVVVPLFLLHVGFALRLKTERQSWTHLVALQVGW